MKYQIGDLATSDEIDKAFDATVGVARWEMKAKLFTDSQDVQWALETHTKQAQRTDIYSILLYGNEDYPLMIWGCGLSVPLITTKWERLA